MARDWQRLLSHSADEGFEADEGTAAPGTGGAAAVEHCPLESEIVEVGFADRPGLKPLFAGTRRQYVNLAREEILQADSNVTSANQLGRTPPVYVRVTPARATTVRLKLQRTLFREGFPAGSAARSAREQGLTHLRWSERERSHTTDANGELLLEPGLHVSALGGGEFHVQAALEGRNFVTSPNAVRIKRRVYLRPVVRYATGRGAALTAMRAIRRQLDALGIEVKLVRGSRGGELGVREEDSLPESLVDIGRRALRSTTQNVRELRPHSIAVIVGEFVTDPIRPHDFIVDVTRSGGSFPASVTVPLVDGGSNYVLVPLDDGSQFVRATLRAGVRTESLDAARVSGLNAFSSQVTVDISAARASFAGLDRVRLTVRLKAISGWAVGWAYTQHPVIYLNMRDPNTGNVLAAGQAEALMIHELGHKLHLAADGDAGQPDRQAHHYPSFNSHGVQHQGPHCSQGVAAGTDLWADAAHNAASCTMWGSLKGITALCNECKTTLRKVDLGGGF